MEYLTKDVDVNEMLKDPLSMRKWELCTKMAFAEDVVNLFDKELDR